MHMIRAALIPGPESVTVKLMNTCGGTMLQSCSAIRNSRTEIGSVSLIETTLGWAFLCNYLFVRN